MSVNKVILVGNVGKDPEVKYFDTGSVLATFTLATNERGYTMANGTQVPDRTEWHNVVCWKGLAQIAEKYVTKGTQLYIEGKIRTRSYDDQNGVKRYVTEINADSLELLSRRGSAEGGGSAPSAMSNTAEPTVAAKPVQPTSSPQTAKPSNDFNSDDSVDDLPF